MNLTVVRLGDLNVSPQRKDPLSAPRLLFTIVCSCSSDHGGKISASSRSNSSTANMPSPPPPRPLEVKSECQDDFIWASGTLVPSVLLGRQPSLLRSVPPWLVSAA